jgi:hypothetical protein
MDWKTSSVIVLNGGSVGGMQLPEKYKDKEIPGHQWRSQPDNLVMLCKYFRVLKP